MSITAKTRKVLWGRSGNRCAICETELVIERKAKDPESIVGEECHIISKKTNGPRHDPSCDANTLDEHDNLILLCATDHKLIDDQTEEYTVHVLQEIKAANERKVSERLSAKDGYPRARFLRSEENIPSYFPIITNGRDLLSLMISVHASYLEHDELASDAEVKIVAGFLQDLRDWADLVSDSGPMKRATAEVSISEGINALANSGFRVFGATELQTVEGGIYGPEDWLVAHVHVLRDDNPNIIKPVEDNDASEDTEADD